MAEEAAKKKRNLAAERSQKVIFKNPCVACSLVVCTRQSGSAVRWCLTGLR